MDLVVAQFAASDIRRGRKCFRPHLPVAWLAGLCLFVACVTPADLLDNRACPCVQGWTCDRSQTPQICVPGNAPDAGESPDGNPFDAGDTGPDAISDTIGDVALDTFVVPSPPAPLDTTCWLRIEGCDWSAPGFTLLEFNGSGRFTNPGAGNPTFSPDGCSVYFNDSASGGDLYRSDRPAPGSAFETPVALDEINSVDSVDEAASRNPDKRELFFTSTRGTADIRRVHRATRMAPTGPWSNISVVAALDLPDTLAWEPRIAPHGLRLYYAPSDLLEMTQGIMVTERELFTGPFGPPSALELDGLGGRNTNRPSVTHDERLLVGIMQDGSEALSREGFYSIREHWEAPWESVQEIPSALPAAGFRDIAVSPDGCEVIIRTLDDETKTAILRYRDSE